MKLPTSIHCAN